MDSNQTVNECKYPACLFYLVRGTEEQTQFEPSLVYFQVLRQKLNSERVLSDI